MELENLTRIIESILFTADHPVALDRIEETLIEVASKEEIAESLLAIQTRYSQGSFGFELREAQNGYHFCTKAQNAEWVRKFLQSKPFRLGKSTLETLAIIAYRQPITRAEIDKIRGIDSSHLLRTLIERGVVKMAGKAEVPGRPVQYGTTPKFLEVIGLKGLSDLPPLSELEQLKGSVDDTANDLDKNLEKFVEEKLQTSEEPEGQYQEGLEKIDAMLKEAGASDKEVFESPIHADVASENLAAVDGFQTSSKPKRRVIHYNELTRGEVGLPTEGIVVTTPTIGSA